MTSSPAPEAGLPPLRLTHEQVFSGSGSGQTYLSIEEWVHPIQYFVGRNGSGKSRTAKLVARMPEAHFLSTDRLTGIMGFNSFGYGTSVAEYRGAPTGPQERQIIERQTAGSGTATSEIYALQEKADVRLKVAAFIRKTLGRSIEMRETSGYLDPVIRTGGVQYSLFREEGHGLRELVVLLAALYRTDWRLLVVDEPELHLHPSMARLWLAEVERECIKSGRRAIVVTHEPTMLKPRYAGDLEAVWLFRQGANPLRLSDAVLPIQRDRVAASLKQNPALVSQLVFAPRPVLVEGVTDVAAFTTALSRTQDPAVVAQTDLVECGGAGTVGLWFEIARKLSIDVRAITDLDALLSPDVQRAMDSENEIQQAYRDAFFTDSPVTSHVLVPLLREADRAGVPADARSRARFLSQLPEGVALSRRERIIDIWKSVGMWLHPQGTLEDVLSLGPEQKGVAEATSAAHIAGPIDAVAQWCAYHLDPTGDLELLLNVSMMQLAHAVMQHERANPGEPYGLSGEVSNVGGGDLAAVTVLGGGAYRLTIRVPEEFAGYWLDFSSESKADDLVLKPPLAAGVPES